MYKAETEDQLVDQPAIDRERLKSQGWTFLNIISDCESEFRERLLSLAAGIGVPVSTRAGGKLCDALVPSESSDSHPRSLSRIHGTGRFPLHNDTAHWVTPCRYIVLGCVQPGGSDRATLLLDTQKAILNDRQSGLLRSTPFLITNGRKSFYSTILASGRPFVRFDQGSMKPTSLEGEKALTVYSLHNWPESIESVRWQAGKVIVIDNWRVLHGRDNVHGRDSDRRILRVSIL